MHLSEGPLAPLIKMAIALEMFLCLDLASRSRSLSIDEVVLCDDLRSFFLPFRLLLGKKLSWHHVELQRSWTIAMICMWMFP
jgi:hypothetical protein